MLPAHCSLLSAAVWHAACARALSGSSLTTTRRSPCSPALPQSPEPSPAQKIVAFKEAFWKFLRPHTIRGTILGSSAVTAIALLENTGLIDWALLPRALLGVLALLCGNGYIVGINQVGGRQGTACMLCSAVRLAHPLGRSWQKQVCAQGSASEVASEPPPHPTHPPTPRRGRSKRAWGTVPPPNRRSLCVCRFTTWRSTR